MENHDSFEQDLKMLQYFQAEFEYRHQHYWHILERFFIVFIIVATLPILKGLLGIEINGNYANHTLVFEMAALAIAVIQLLVLTDEGKKIKAINSSKYALSHSMKRKEYRYVMYDNKNKDGDKQKPVSKKRKKVGLAQRLPWLIFLFQIIIIVTVFVITIL